MSSSNKSLHFSDRFVISCGTITVDANQRKVLLIHWTKNNTCLFPKGRKDVDEDLASTALRETFEETGYRVTLRPSELPTLQTSEHASHEQHTEAFAVQQRTVGNKLKIIFWYLAEADSTKEPENKLREEDQEFDNEWVSYDDAEKTLTFDDDKDLCKRALQYC